MRNSELDSKRMKSKKKRRENEVEVLNEEERRERNPGDGKKKRRRETEVAANEVVSATTLIEAEKVKKNKKKKKTKKEGKGIVEKSTPVDEYDQLDDGSAGQIGKSKKSKKSKKMKQVAASEGVDMQGEAEKQEKEDVYCISSGDEDGSKGMKKWMAEYHESRPGLNVLQQRIDDFIISHEEKLEEERKEREAQAADGGWTVVVHQRGRKKTTDPESGIAVGSAVPVATVDDIATKKKRREVGVDFYRFQKREAHRSEILQLQSKFEEDKKRIQQLRAARKFRPY